MNNSKKKQEAWNKIENKLKHLSDYYTIELSGLEDDNIYFHPKFILDENTYIVAQCDVGHNNKHMYAFRFIHENFSIEIYDDIFEPIVIGFHVNKEKVLFALETMYKVKNHINSINGQISDYIHNILVGNSIEESSKVLINEIKTVNEVVKYLK